MKIQKAHDALRNYVHLKDSGQSELLPIPETFWGDLAQGAYPQLEQGRLMSVFSFSEPWSDWECHPAGEEVVMLLAGSAELLLEEVGGKRVVELRASGDFVLVPRGIWHTARTSVATTMLFLTPGAGTIHRPV